MYPKLFIIQKAKKPSIQDLQFVTADNKNAIETSIFAISSPQKAMIVILIGL